MLFHGELTQVFLGLLRTQCSLYSACAQKHITLAVQVQMPRPVPCNPGWAALSVTLPGAWLPNHRIYVLLFLDARTKTHQGSPDSCAQHSTCLWSSYWVSSFFKVAEDSLGDWIQTTMLVWKQLPLPAGNKADMGWFRPFGASTAMIWQPYFSSCIQHLLQMGA